MLAGGHLLTLPRLAEKAETLISSADQVCKRLAVLLGYKPEAVEQFGGISYLLEDYLIERGIARDNNPLAYGLSVDSYEEIVQYLAEEEVQMRMDQKSHYIGLFFISETFTEDIGYELEEIEHKNPGLGAWLLDRFDISPCNILTPEKIYEQADFLLGWDEMRDERYVHDDEEVTREKFQEYYPDWAYKRFNDPPPDITPWPQLAELRKREDEFIFAEARFPCREQDRNLIIPEGADMYSGTIAWTKDRNEVERDIGYRVSNNLYQDMMYANGVNPGCMQFEFVMDKEHEASNSLMADLLDKFVRYLATLDRVFDDINGGAFR